ncbi:MAG: Bax inhibitor-1/YccA family protein [Prolixibacteraceae bacterium]|nr:Bax inhibitor-1/YccA family protein [Prolixibacteraceae bacterium]MBN2648849.1 Bax inhibitor-1/YccA family protein [Prolixibacteraceae bacterium]
MNLTKSSNPVLGSRMFERAQTSYVGDERMTLNGTINKTALVILFVFASAYYVWQQFFGVFDPANPGAASGSVTPFILIGGIGGFIVAMIASFSPKRSGILTPVYAILEGLFLGGLSAMFEARFPGLVVKAVALTFMVFLSMLLVYRQRIIKVTGKFRRGMMSAMMGLLFFYLASWIAGMFGANVSYLSGGGSFGLIFSLIVTAISAFSLLLDFDFIERGAAAGAPKYMEWYGVFGLLVSLVWLYVNILRLLSIFASRD